MSLKMSAIKNIFAAFFRCGILGYGGGPSSMPLVRREAVVTYKWMTDEEFGDVVALANTLPGPLATKVAGYIGYRVGGSLGCAAALIATVIPTAALMIGLLVTLEHFSEYPWVQGMARAVLPVVAVMLGVLAFQFFQTAAKGMKIWAVVLHVAAVGVLTVFFGVHPAIIIAVLLVFALCGGKIFKKG